jgi:hypothetical protein
MQFSKCFRPNLPGKRGDGLVRNGFTDSCVSFFNSAWRPNCEP